MTFNEMELVQPLMQAVEEAGYIEPSPIQAEAIPVLLQGRDIIGCAQTGSGKTAAFALPILQRLSTGKSTQIRALILTPTRELAIQIYDTFRYFGRRLRLHSGVVFGGVSQNPQVDALTRGLDILIATPGRLNDLINQGYIHLDHIEIFVLDEADRMLDMGFIHDVKKTIKLLPTQRQTMLFSATMPTEIETLAQTLLKNPAMIKVDPVTRAVESIDQRVYMVDKPNKTLLLAELLRTEDIKNALVFTNTKHGADRVVQKLSQEGFVARAIHGDKTQNARQDALKSFRDGRVQILVATDIAARGIDIPELSHVINYDLPDVAETYIHRIGRTGRAGLGGTAISFCNIDHVDNLRSIEKMTGLRIPVRESQWPMQIFEKTVKQPRPPRPERRPTPGKRFSTPAKPKQRKPER